MIGFSSSAGDLTDFSRLLLSERELTELIAARSDRLADGVLMPQRVLSFVLQKIIGRSIAIRTADCDCVLGSTTSGSPRTCTAHVFFFFAY